jgi:hypothetical protein
MHRRFTHWLALWLAAAFLAGATGRTLAAPDGEPADVIAVRLQPGERLRLDGTLSHPAWRRAPVFADFVEKMPELGSVPKHATQVQVLFDDDALYIGIRALDPQPELIRAPLVRHDMVNRTQDFVGVYIDAIGNRQSAQFFRVNAAGSTGDGMQTASDDSEDFSPDFDFDAAAARNDQGYTAMLRIPFASLRFAGEGKPAWRFMVVRRVPREQFCLYSSVLIPREAPSFIATLQALRGVELPERHQFLSLRPSLTLRQSTDQPAGQPAQRQRQADLSLDLKWRPRAEWVVDATLRPDFSQVALDVPQLAGNTRYALAFPEKRPFFFESSDLLRSPTDALYTRSFTEPRWGLRSTWRGLNLSGSAFGIDDKGGGQVLIPNAWGTGVAEQPASRSLAARGLYDTGSVQWGGLAVARQYAGDRGGNRVIGPDVGWQIDPSWRLRAQWLQSETTALPDAGGQLQRGPALGGRRLLVKALYQGDLADGSVSVDDIDAGFRHDTGFVNQSGVRSLALAHGRGWAPLGPFNEIWPSLHFEQTEDKASGRLVSRDVYPGLWFAAARNLEVYLTWHGNAPLRTGPDAPLLAQHFWRGELTMTPAEWVPLLQLNGRIGRVADVLANATRPGGNLSLTVTTRPMARLELEPRWDAAWLERDGRLTYREAAAQVLAVWHFDARQTLRAIVQRTSLDRLAEPGVAALRDVGTVGSLTYAYRRAAGSVLYIGASRSRQGVSALTRGNELFIKLQFDTDDVRSAF